MPKRPWKAGASAKGAGLPRKKMLPGVLSQPGGDPMIREETGLKRALSLYKNSSLERKS